MNKTTSLYLDFLRVIAAFGVMLVHANQTWFSNSLFVRGELGHKLVMIFFVLSGYLIAFTVDKKNKGSEKYLIDRISRLYSVVIPALILTFILDSLGKKINPGFYIDKVNSGNQWLRYLLNATFLQQIWGLCTRPSTNTPFWSIGYEFWYYIIFWVFCYFTGAKRYLGLLLICLVIGLKILLLLPVWFFGVWAYRYSGKLAISKRAALTMFILTLATLFILTYVWEFSFLPTKLVFGKAPLYFSSLFAFDWVYGLLVAINLFSVSYLFVLVEAPDFISRPIKYLSSITFSLYLYHGPMLIFLAAIVTYNKSSYLQTIGLMAVLLVTVAILSQITEKQRNIWKRVLENIFVKNKTSITHNE